MKIGLIDVDGHNFPNLPLMKISAWHKAQGDTVRWYEPFDGLLEKYDKVYLSKVFSFSHDYDLPIYADSVVKGGSGYCIKLINGSEVYDTSLDNELPYEVEHIYPDYSIYPELTRDTAYGYLTRGCPRNCAFCHTTQKDGFRSRKVANLAEFWKDQKNIILLDQNILACREHIDLLRQLVDSKATVEFNGGLDIRLINDDNLELIKQIKIDSIHLAFDRWQDKDVVEPKLREFAEKTGYHRNNRRIMVYVLCNYDTTLEQDIYRIQLCRELHFQPFVMIYDKANCDPVYRKLQRWCSPFIFWKCLDFKDYTRNKTKQEVTHET